MVKHKIILHLWIEYKYPTTKIRILLEVTNDRNYFDSDINIYNYMGYFISFNILIAFPTALSTFFSLPHNAIYLPSLRLITRPTHFARDPKYCKLRVKLQNLTSEVEVGEKLLKNEVFRTNSRHYLLISLNYSSLILYWSISSTICLTLF